MDPVVILGTQSVAAGPGQEARLPVRIRNQGRRVESYRIDVVGGPAGFCQVDPDTVSVLPGREAEVTVWFRPPAGPGTPTGSLPFVVRATSEVESSSSAAAEGVLELAGVTGLQAWAETTTQSGRWSARYKLAFANQGNVPVRLAVTAHDPAASLNLVVASEVVEVAAGGQAGTEVKAKARQPFLRGTPVNRIFQVACQSFPFGAPRPLPGETAAPDDPNHRTFQLSFQQKPILSKGAILVLLLVVALIAALILLRFRRSDEQLLRTAPPETPPSFMATSAGSSSIFLSWERVPNATGYDIRTTTADGQLTGPVLDQADALAVTYEVTDLGPQEEHCFAVQARGPEGVASSPPSVHACVTTDPPPVLPAPTLALQKTGANTFDLQWEYPAPTDGVTFTVLVRGSPHLENISGLETRIELPQEEQAYTAPVSVRAHRGEDNSDQSNTQDAIVDALTPTTTAAVATTVPAGGPGGPVGGPGATTPGQDPATATTAAGPTTVAGATTTTGVPSPAQDKLQDLEETWAAVLNSVSVTPAGVGEAAQRAALAEDFNVEADDIATFSDRDTIATDVEGNPAVFTTEGTPDDSFFYVEVPNPTLGAGLCGSDTRCRVARIRGAADRAEGTEIVIVGQLPITASIQDVDAALLQRREQFASKSIYALDGSKRPQFPDDQIILFATGFTDAPAATAFCTQNRISPCDHVVMAPGG